MGAIGVTCAKIDEAEVLVRAGIRDILIANEVVERSKIGRLAGVDVGLHQCGVTPGEAALELAHRVMAARNLRLMGLMGYEGHAVLCPSREERVALAHAAIEQLIDTRNLLERAGLEVQIVSAGATGTYDITGVYPGVTEVQAGSYVLMDSRYATTGVDFELALSLLTTVISRPSPRRLILDAGMKSITHEFGYPTIKDQPHLVMTSLHEEHAIVRVEEGFDTDLQVGDKVELVVSHVCTTINLHDCYVGGRQGVSEVVLPIPGRGMFR